MHVQPSHQPWRPWLLTPSTTNSSRKPCTCADAHTDTDRVVTFQFGHRPEREFVAHHHACMMIEQTTKARARRPRPRRKASDRRSTGDGATVSPSNLRSGGRFSSDSGRWWWTTTHPCMHENDGCMHASTQQTLCYGGEAIMWIQTKHCSGRATRPSRSKTNSLFA